MSEDQSYEFKHFDTIHDCEEYIRHTLRSPIAYTCCGGKGFAILRSEPPRHLIVKDHSKRKVDDLPRVIRGTCDICFLEDKSLYSTCTCCKQPLCHDCLKQLRELLCPFCRGSLNVKAINL